MDEIELMVGVMARGNMDSNESVAAQLLALRGDCPACGKVRTAIGHTKHELAKPDCDAQVAIIGLRDYQIVKDADLSDLAWAIYRGNAHKNDVLGFIELLEKYLAGCPDCKGTGKVRVLFTKSEVEQAREEMACALFEEVICPMCCRLNPQHATADASVGCHYCQEREDWKAQGGKVNV